MNQTFLFVLLALFTGTLIPVQASLNTLLNKTSGNPLVTALVVFSVGLVTLLLLLFCTRTAPPRILGAPWFSYLGGIIIAFYILMIPVVTPKLGVAMTIGLIVSGQVLAAVVIDHFGLLRMAVRSVSIIRIVGVVLMLIGIYLVMKTNK